MSGFRTSFRPGTASHPGSEVWGVNMGAITLLIVAASAIGACVASVKLVRIYNERPLWSRRDSGEKSPQEILQKNRS